MRGDNLLEPRAALRASHGVTSGTEKLTRHSNRQFAILGWHAANNTKQLERLRTASIYGNVPSTTSRPASEGRAPHVERAPVYGWVQTWQPSSSRPASEGSQKVEPSSGVARPPNPQLPVDLLIDAMRHRLEAGGTVALSNLMQFFKRVDRDESGALDLKEFTKALLDLKLLHTAEECEAVFRYYDTDKTGSIDIHEFEDTFFGRLPENRRRVVHEAFQLLDRDGNGVLSIDDLVRIYKTYAHPDVKAGVRTEEEVLRDFLNVFDTILSDGTVALPEFEQYYEGISMLIKSDEYFESMLRNTWHLPGAGGGHCLRLHIACNVQDRRTHAWKTVQDHVEIRPDIGINRHDPHFFQQCVKRLEEMGYHGVVDIEVLGRY